MPLWVRGLVTEVVASAGALAKGAGVLRACRRAPRLPGPGWCTSPVGKGLPGAEAAGAEPSGAVWAVQAGSCGSLAGRHARLGCVADPAPAPGRVSRSRCMVRQRKLNCFPFYLLLARERLSNTGSDFWRERKKKGVPKRSALKSEICVCLPLAVRKRYGRTMQNSLELSSFAVPKGGHQISGYASVVR